MMLFIIYLGLSIGMFQGPELFIGKIQTISSQTQGLAIVEPHISAHPISENHLLAAAMIVHDKNRPYESCQLVTFVSTDGGASWKETQHDLWGYDPWTSLLEDGTTIVSWLGTEGSFRHQFPLQLLSSRDGGLTWDDKLVTFHNYHGHDGTKIVTDGQQFYISTAQFNENMGADIVVFKGHPDDEFSELTRVDGHGTRLNFCEPVVTFDKHLVVPASEYLRKVWIHRVDPETSVMLPEKTMISVNPGGNRGYMRLVADNHEKSPFRNALYLVRSTNEGIVLSRSVDGGINWKKDQMLLDQKTVLATPAVNQEGTLLISYIERSANTSELQIKLIYSFDGGNEFSQPVAVESKGYDPNTTANGDVANRFVGGGHYMDIAVKSDGSFQLIWSDSRSGVFELQTTLVRIN